MATDNQVPDFQKRAEGIYEQMRGYATIYQCDASVFDNPRFKELCIEYIKVTLSNVHLQGRGLGKAQGLEEAVRRIMNKKS